jgi:hypothetical protein
MPNEKGKEDEVVEVFVSGVSMAGKSELKNDSDRPVEEDSEQSQRGEGDDS